MNRERKNISNTMLIGAVVISVLSGGVNLAQGGPQPKQVNPESSDTRHQEQESGDRRDLKPGSTDSQKDGSKKNDNPRTKRAQKPKPDDRRDLKPSSVEGTKSKPESGEMREQ